MNKKAKMISWSVILSAILILIIYGATFALSDPPAGCPTGMVSYWKFDEGDGTTADDFYDGNDGTLINNPAWVDGKIGKALSFDGDDYISVPDSSNLDITSAVTVEAWVNFGSLSNYQTIIAKRGLDSNLAGNYDLRLNLNELEFYYHDG